MFLSFRNGLYVLYINLLSDTICKYFLPFHRFLFHFVGSFHWCAKVLNFHHVHLSVFSSVTWAFGFISRKSFPNPVFWSFCPMFSFNFIVLDLMFRSLIHSELICGVWTIWLHSFACEYSFFPIAPVEKTVLSSLCGLGVLVKDHLTYMLRVYFWSLISVPLVCMSIYMPGTSCSIIAL